MFLCDVYPKYENYTDYLSKLKKVLEKTLFVRKKAHGLKHTKHRVFVSLFFSGVPMTWHLGFRHGNRFYYYMPAYLKKYGNYLPGKVHLFFLMEEGFADGILFEELKTVKLVRLRIQLRFMN